MSESRTKGGRSRSAGFPTGTRRLSWKIGCSCRWPKFRKTSPIPAYLLKHTAARHAYLLHKPPAIVACTPFPWPCAETALAWPRPRPPEVARTSRSTPGGTHYMISLSYTSNTLATNVAEGSNGQLGNTSTTDLRRTGFAGSIDLPAADRHRSSLRDAGVSVGIIVDGSTQNTELTINPLGRQPSRRGSRRATPTARPIWVTSSMSARSPSIAVRSATSRGSRTAVLSGPLVASGTTSIDRIAFDAILPGASITTGGDVNTLDVLNGITLSGTSINIGRDLNLLNVGGNIDLTNGAQFNIGRNLGLVSQPPKGTGTGTNVLTLNYTSVANSIVTVNIPAVGAYIQGNVTIDPTSSFNIGVTSQGNIISTMAVEGTTTAGFIPATPPVTFSSTTQGTLSRLTINGLPAPLLQTQLSQFLNSETTTDRYYVTSLGGFA